MFKQEEISSLSTLPFYFITFRQYRLTSQSLLLSALVTLMLPFQLRTKQKQSLHMSGATGAISSQMMICRASLAQVMGFQTNSSTSYHHASHWTMQVQCFFRQTSEKFSLIFCEGLDGTKRSNSVQPHVGPAFLNLLHSSVVGVPVSCLLSWMYLVPVS